MGGIPAIVVQKLPDLGTGEKASSLALELLSLACADPEQVAATDNTLEMLVVQQETQKQAPVEVAVQNSELPMRYAVAAAELLVEQNHSSEPLRQKRTVPAASVPHLETADSLARPRQSGSRPAGLLVGKAYFHVEGSL